MEIPDSLLGQIALERGWITSVQLEDAVQEQAREKSSGRPKTRSLSQILLEKRYLTEGQLKTVQGPRESISAVPSARKPEAPLPPFGKYSLLRVLGRGGMGIVYEALDTQLDRKVALKMMLTHEHASPKEARQEEERFLREAKLSANLAKHPHIVSVYEAGIIQEKRYLSMEFIDGQPMSRWRKQSSPSLKDQIGVLRDVAQAVHHAHQNGIIHRDLKPENILIDSEGKPHVTDFGLAKRIGQDVHLSLTAAGLAMGTPAYMSPEQAQGAKSVDARTDVYSLGIMLYEALTGRPPFTGQTAIEILMKAARDPVPRPLTLAPKQSAGGVDSAIENIALKALARNPQDRYLTADLLAADLSRWLSGEEVKIALPPSRRVWRRRRSRIRIAVVSVAIVLGISGAVLLALSYRPHSDALGQARHLMAHGKYPEALALYESVMEKDPQNSEAQSGVEAASAKLDLAESEKKLQKLRREEKKSPGKGPEPAPGASSPGLPSEEEWKKGINLLSLLDPTRDNVSGTWTWQDQKMVSGLLARTRIEIPYRPPEEYDLRVVFTRLSGAAPVVIVLSRSGRPFDWIMGTGGNTWVGFEYVRGMSSTVGPASFHLSQALATGSPHTAVLQVRRSGLTGYLDGQRVVQWGTDYSDISLPATWRLRDGGILGLGSGGSPVSFERVELLEVTGRGAALPPPPVAYLKAIPLKMGDLQPGLVAEYFSGTNFEVPVLRQIDPAINFQWGEGAPWPGGPCDWFSCRWKGYLRVPRGGEVAFTLTSDEGVRMTLDDTPVLLNWVSHAEAPNTVRCVLEAGYHKLTVEYFDETQTATAVLSWVSPETPKLLPIPPECFFHKPADFAPAALAPSKELRRSFPPQNFPLHSIAVSADGKLLASGGEDRAIRIWDPATGKDVRTIRGQGASVFSVALHPKGEQASSCMWGGRVRVWNVASGAEVLTIAAHAESALAAAWSPDGLSLATGGNDRLLKLWRLDSGKEIRRFEGHGGAVTAVAWSSDQKLLASGSADQTVRLWDSEAGKALHILSGHTSQVSSVALSPDRKLIASGSYDRTVKLWDAATGNEVRTLSGHTDQVRGVAFRPDGKILASVSRDTTIRLWDASTGQELRTLIGHAGGVAAVAFLPDGKTLASTGWDSTVRLWDVK